MFLEQYFLQSGITLTPEIELVLPAAAGDPGPDRPGGGRRDPGVCAGRLDAGDIRLLKTDFTIPARSVDMCTLQDVTPTAAASAFMEMVRDGR